MHNNIDKLDSRYTAETPLQILLVDCRHSLDRTISRSYRIEIQETLTQWKHTDSGQKKQKEDGKGRDDTFDRIMEEDLANQLKLLEIQELKDTEGQSRLATRKPSERIARQEEKYYPASHQRCRPTPSPYRQPERKPIGNHGIKVSNDPREAHRSFGSFLFV